MAAVVGALLSGAAVTLATVVGGAGPASAAVPSPDAQYYRSSVVSLEPATPGLEVTVLGNGESVTLENRSGKEVVVLGYGGEPYLRFTASGVDENVTGISTQLNAGKSPEAHLGKQTVTWEHRTDELRYTWRDFRVQWSAKQRPPIVLQDEHAQHRVFDWAVPLTVAGQQVLVRGAVDWVGVPRFSTGQLILGGLALVTFVGAGVAVFIVTRRRRGRGTGSRTAVPTLERVPALTGVPADSPPATPGDPYSQFREGPSSPADDVDHRDGHRHR